MSSRWVRCWAYTLAGKRCRGTAEPYWRYCGRHRRHRTTDLPYGTFPLMLRKSD